MDVAFKVITAMRVPDHSTIAEFRRRHEREIAELFDGVLGLCKEAGLVSVGVIMIDGTKIKANASMDQNRSYSGVVREIARQLGRAPSTISRELQRNAAIGRGRVNIELRPLRGMRSVALNDPSRQSSR